VIRRQVASGLNTPLTSSMGRLFDAVSALLGICHAASYEGQAAIELEAAVDPAGIESGAYCFTLEDARQSTRQACWRRSSRIRPRAFRPEALLRASITPSPR
jgi:hydrogenase maturation protein HypF